MWHQQVICSAKAAAATQARIAAKERLIHVAEQAKLYTDPPLPRTAVRILAGAIVDRNLCDDPLDFSLPHSDLTTVPWHTTEQHLEGLALAQMLEPWEACSTKLLERSLDSITRCSNDSSGVDHVVFPAPEPGSVRHREVSEAGWFKTLLSLNHGFAGFSVPKLATSVGRPHYMCFASRSCHHGWTSLPVDGTGSWLHCMSGTVLVLCVNTVVLGTPTTPIFDLACKLQSGSTRNLTKWLTTHDPNDSTACLLMLTKGSIAYLPFGHVCYVVVADDSSATLVAVPHLTGTPPTGHPQHEAVMAVLKSNAGQHCEVKKGAWIGDYAKLFAASA